MLSIRSEILPTLITVCFVEVMEAGDAGFIALSCAIASGAEAVVIPETETNIDNLVTIPGKGWYRHKKSSAIVVVAEAMKPAEPMT